MNRWKKKIGDVHLMNKNETLCGIPMLGNNYAVENEQVTCGVCKEKKKEELLKIVELNKSGYAGCLPNGNIVDRREFPNAIPIQKNSLFGVVEPKELPQIDKRTNFYDSNT